MIEIFRSQNIKGQRRGCSKESRFFYTYKAEESERDFRKVAFWKGLREFIAICLQLSLI